MGRPGRVGVLLVALLAVGLVGSVTVPPHLDDGTESVAEQCTFYFLASDVGPTDAVDRESATPYEKLGPERQALFDRWLANDSRTLTIDAEEWRALYDISHSSQYVAYDGRYYRTTVSFNRCELWEALAASN